MTDERKGLVKTYWHQIRDRVKAVEPTFCAIVDQLSPGKEFPIYIAYYPYGALLGDTKSPIIPTAEGGFYRLGSLDTPKDVMKDLAYGINDMPFGMVLEKQLEYFVDLNDGFGTIPCAICKPGTFFPLNRILRKTESRIYAPNGILTASAGARSVFMLPNIGCSTSHSNLLRDYYVQAATPKALYEHWNIFKQIINSPVTTCSWRAAVILFSEPWLQNLLHDDTWQLLKLYLYELAWRKFEYNQCHYYYDIVFSLMQKKKNLKPNPYLTDTARHLFATALGKAPGYTPVCNNDALPVDIIQEAYINSYGLKKYLPIVMAPHAFRYEQNDKPVYYSLLNPSTFTFSPKSRRTSSTLLEMRELHHIMKAFTSELAKEDGICSDTILCTIAQNVEFKYFHNKADRHKVIDSSADMIKYDSNLENIKSSYKVDGAAFSTDAPFVRGCISVQLKT